MLCFYTRLYKILTKYLNILSYQIAKSFSWNHFGFINPLSFFWLNETHFLFTFFLPYEAGADNQRKTHFHPKWRIRLSCQKGCRSHTARNKHTSTHIRIRVSSHGLCDLTVFNDRWSTRQSETVRDKCSIQYSMCDFVQKVRVKHLIN